MTHDGERGDPTLDRLRAADPARDVQADLPALRARVTARLGQEADDERGDRLDVPIELPGADVVSLDAARRRRRSGLRAIGVAAALAIVAVSGYGLGSTVSAGSGGGSDSAGAGDDAGLGSEAAPPITLDSPANPMEDMQGGGGDDGSSLAARGEAGSADMSMPWGSGRVVFTASGLSTEPGASATWGLDPGAAATAERAAQAAAVLGVDGTPEQRDGGWYVGADSELSISLDGTAALGYYSPAARTEDGTPPAADAAIGVLRDTMAALGVDVGAYEFAAEPYDGVATTYVTAELVVDGQRTGLSWSGEVGTDGVLSLWGSLADVVPLGDYPVVSEQEAYERLTDPRFGAAPTMWPEYADDAMAEREYVPPTQAPAAPTGDSAVSWPVRDVTLTGVRLGLATHYQVDGSVLLVPTYAFADSDGGEWSVVAVADDRLDFSADDVG